MNDITPEWAWRFLPIGYLLTIAVETPILWFGLSPRHSPRTRLLAGVWLTACTYPIVVLVLPMLMHDGSRGAYLAVAETFAPLAECALFYVAFAGRSIVETTDSHSERRAELRRDFLAIVGANLASFLLGEAIGWWYAGA